MKALWIKSSLLLMLTLVGCSKNADLGNLPGGKKIPVPAPGGVATVSKLVFSSQDVSFTNTSLNQTNVSSLTITNKGNKNSGTLGLMFLIQPSAPFTLINDNCSNKILAIDESCSLAVEFKPTLALNNLNILRVADSQSTAQVILRGQGINPNAGGVSSGIPTVNNGSLSLLEDTVGSGLLAGSDPNGKSLTYEIVDQGTKGTVNITNPTTGEYTYTPITNENGVDSFTFKVKNSDGIDSTAGTVNITITPVNDNPVANNSLITTNEDTVKNGTLSAVDVDGDSLVYSIVNQGTNGIVSVSPTTGAFTYTPNSNANGTDSFTFKVNDGAVESNTATVTVNITSVNDLPIANNQIISTMEDTPKTGILTGSDSDGSAVTYLISSQGNKGTVVITNATTGAFTYTPNANANGTDSFTFQVNDGTANSNLGTVTVNISPINDTPIADNGSFSTNEDTVYNGALVATDVDGDSLTYTIIDSPSKGTITITNSSNGSFVYTPNADAKGSDSFTFKVNDGTVDSNVATINLNINSLNDAPISIDSSITTAEDTVKNSSVSASDTDLDALSYSVVIQPTHGVVVMNPDGTYSYTPAANYNGPDSFTFKANDGILDSNISTVSVTVTPVNDAPVADDLNKLTLKNTAVNIDLTASDVDGDSLTYTVVAQPTHGTLTGTVPNLIYTPNNNYSGTDSFTFKVNDSSLDSNIATVSISITNTNTAPVANNQSITTNEDTAKNGTLVATDLDADILTYSVVAQGSKGTVTITDTSTGAFTYTPNPNAIGSDSFTFKVIDGALDSNTATVNVTITPVNDLPIANNDVFTTNEDIAYNGTLTASDIESDPLTYSVVAQGSKGTVTITNSATGAFTYTPNANANGADSFTFKVNDGTGDSNIATIGVTITSVNDAPLAVGDTVPTAEDTAVNIILIGTDVDGDSLVYSLVGSPTHGTLSGTIPNLVYTPSANYNGSDSFTFKVNDGTVDSNTATINITVTGGNDAPVANNQSITTNEDTANNGTLVATDLDADTLTYSVVAQGSKGTVTITNSATGAFTYTPNANANGADSFTFKVNDGTIDSNVATVSVTITPINDAPISTNSSIATSEETDYNGILTASDIDADTLTYSVVAQGSKGTVTITNSATGAFTYSPNSNSTGSDSFTFKVNDGTVDSNTSTVSVTINGVNDAPVVAAVNFTTNEDTAYNGTLTGTDSDGDTLTYSAVVNPTHGIVSINSTTGAYTYTPTANYNGPDSFTYKANDGTVDSNIATITVTVTSVNDAPVTIGDSITTNEDTAYNGVLIASDVDGDSLVYSVVAQGTKGVVTITNTATGAYTYTPNANENGSDSFTFRVNDGTVNSNTSTVSVTITATNDAPVVSANSFTTNEDTAYNGTLVGTDTDGNALVYSVVAQGSKGTVTITNTATGAYTYTPNANANGSDSFTFKANDGTVDSNIATITVTITPINDAPVANNQSISTNEDTANNGTLVATDVDGNSLTYSVVAQGSKGTVTITNSATGAFTYTPNANATGADSFTFKANDGTVDSNIATVSVTITGINDAPVAASGSHTVNEDAVLSSGVFVLDYDGNPLTYTIVSNPAHGTVSMNASTGSFTYTPTANYNGPDSFTYKANDGTVDSNVATRNITVTPVNDAPVTIGDTISTNEDTAYNGVLIASDVDGDALTYSIVDQGTKGTVTINNSATGTFTYTPNANVSGADSFTFKVNDGTVDSNTSTVNITITPVNDAPIANNQSFTTNEDTAYNGTLVGTDTEGSALTYSVVAQGSKGTVTITNSATGAFTYTPNANANGADSFTFRVNDGTANSNTATVSVTITPVNDRPVWTTSTTINLTTNMNTPVNTTINATDVDGDIVTYSIGGCAGGTCNLNASTGYFTFTPNTGYTGTVGFSFYGYDGSLYTSPMTIINIQIVNPNTAPVATAQSVDYLVNTSNKTITLAGTDAESDPLTYSVVASPTEGTLSGTAPNLTYTPSAWTNCASENTTCSFTGTKLVKYGTATEYVVKQLTGGTMCDNITFSDPSPGNSKTCSIKNTTDSFTFKVNDGTVDSSTAIVTINVKEWYNASWNYRRKLVFNLPITSDLFNFPVMIKLDSSRIDYAQTQNSGQDIRFVDSNGTLLAHEIEKWDESGTSIAWVKVSAGYGETNNKYIWMYYGNSSVADGQQKTSVWSNGYAAVYHLAETSGSVLDSTSNANNGTVVGTLTRNTTGYIGNSYTNASNSACFSVPHNSSHAIGPEWTLESWAKRTTSNANRALIHKNLKNGANWYWAYSLGDNSGYVLSTITDNAYGSTNYATSAVQFANNEWMHMGVTFKDSTNTVKAYKNGKNIESNTAATRAGYTGSLWMELNMMGDCNSQGFLGAMDEIRISNVARSDEWMTVQYLSQTDGLLMYSTEQTISNPINYTSYQIRISANGDDGNNIVGLSSGQWNNSGWNAAGVNWVGEEVAQDAWGYYRFQLPKAIPSSGVVNARFKTKGQVESSNSQIWNNASNYLKIVAERSSSAPQITAQTQKPGSGITTTTTNTLWNSGSLTWNWTGWNTSPDITSVINEVAANHSLSANNYVQLWINRGGNLGCGAGGYCQVGMTDYFLNPNWGSRLLIEW